MAKVKDIVGKTFGRLTVLSRASLPGESVRWNCKCACGNEKSILGGHLRSGKILSCGCLSSENTANRNKQNIKHGYYGTPTYKSWDAMKQRCLNPNAPNYEDYGGRGIAVCDRWINSFKTFLEDVGERPPGTTLDRVDNDGDYVPGNTRWATEAEQKRNRSDNVHITYQGKTLTISEWSEETGISYQQIWFRINNGCPLDLVFDPEPRVGKRPFWK